MSRGRVYLVGRGALTEHSHIQASGKDQIVFPWLVQLCYSLTGSALTLRDCVADDRGQTLAPPLSPLQPCPLIQMVSPGSEDSR